MGVVTKLRPDRRGRTVAKLSRQQLAMMALTIVLISLPGCIDEVRGG